MPLDHGYGVLQGTLTGHYRDTPDDQGRWYHVHLVIDVAGVDYEAAIDVDSKQSAVGVEWKVVAVRSHELGPAAGVSDRYQSLASRSTSGALDHIRHPVTRAWRLRLRRVGPWPWFRLPWIVYQPWRSGSHLEASAALEGMLAVGQVAYVWGEPFTSGHGLHNVHQNQGDPAGSQWWAENGIWQDGGVAVMAQGGDEGLLFVSKFSSQASGTDADGHPTSR